MLRRWHILLFCAALVIFGLALTPISLIAPQRVGIASYASSQGTIWGAKFNDVVFGQYRLSTVTWAPDPIALLTGRFAGEVSLAGDIEGSVWFAAGPGGSIRVRTQNLVISGAQLRPGVPLDGMTVLSGVDLSFNSGGCVRASGQIDTDLPVDAFARFGLASRSLTGGARCVADAAVFQLDSAEAPGRLTARITLRGDGGGEWRVQVRSAMQLENDALAAMGLVWNDTERAHIAKGELRWVPL